MKLSNEQNNVVKALTELGLSGMAEGAANQFNNEGVYSDFTFTQRLQDLIDREEAHKNTQRYNRIIRQAKLKFILNFNEIHFGESDGISKDTLQYLVSNHWALVNPVNIYIQGKTGVGKTRLCCCLLNNLAMEGHTVRFWRMCDLQQEIDRLGKDPNKLKSFTSKLVRYDVLAIDDLGLNSEPLGAQIVSVLFNIIDARLPDKPLVITTQMRPEGLLRVLGNGAQAEAIMDRLLRPSKVIVLKGESKRPKLK